MDRRTSLLLLLLLTLAFGGCQKKPDPVSSTRRFFELVASGQAATAYESAAFGFQAQRSAAVFEAAAKEMGLADYASAEWETPEIEGPSAKLNVRVKTRAGKEFPLIVTLNDESGAWRIFSLRSPPSETTGLSENRFSLVGKTPSFTDSVPQPIPPDAEQRQLVRENLLRFNESIASKSFDSFYDSVSRKWQDQLTKGQLQRAFQPFIDKRVNLAEVAKLDPIWNSAPLLSPDGLLRLSGYYPTEPYRIHFELKFLYELPNWKLFGIDVNLRK
jgi:hypothetical protein